MQEKVESSDAYTPVHHVQGDRNPCLRAGILPVIHIHTSNNFVSVTNLFEPTIFVPSGHEREPREVVAPPSPPLPLPPCSSPECFSSLSSCASSLHPPSRAGLRFLRSSLALWSSSRMVGLSRRYCCRFLAFGAALPTKTRPLRASLTAMRCFPTPSVR